MTYKIGWFSTGRDKAARDLLKTVYENVKGGQIENSEIGFVFSNRVKGEDKDMVEKLGLNLTCLSCRKFNPEVGKREVERWRELYDGEIIKRIDKFKVDLIVLAGYMLILGRNICRRYS